MRNSALLVFQDHYGNLPCLIYIHFNSHGELNPPAKLMQYCIQTVIQNTFHSRTPERPAGCKKRMVYTQMCCYINALLNPRIDLFYPSERASVAHQFINVPNGASDEIVTLISTTDI